MIVEKILVEIMIYAAILYGAISLFRKICGNKMSPALRYGLWFLVVLRLAVPFTLESDWHLIELPVMEQAEKARPVVAKLEDASGEIAGADEIFLAGVAGEDSIAGVNREHSTIDSLKIQDLAGTESRLQSGTNAVFEGVQEQRMTVQENAAGIAINIFIWENYLWILAGVWMAGFLFCVARNILTGMRIKKALRSSGMEADSRFRKIYQNCCQTLGIQKELPVYLIEGITTPALTVGLRPDLLFPADMAVVMNERQITYALSHELTHYRRRDHLVCLLLRGLECIYWFYPLVRRLEQRILMDMETACDSQVVASMDNENRKYYAATLLEMFTQDREPNLMLGMASGDTREEAERRIRGIFQKRKSHYGVRMVALVLVFILALGCFTTACQPVVKADEASQDTQENGADAFTNEDTDAEGQMSEKQASEDSEKICLVSDRNIDIEDVKRFLELILGDKPLYKTYEDSGIRSREEIQQAINQSKLELNGAAKQNDKLHIAMYTQEIESLQKEYENTPEEVIYEEVDLSEWETSLPYITGEKIGQYWADSGEKRYVLFARSRIDMGIYAGKNVYPLGASFSEEEAVEKGLDFLMKMGLNCKFLSLETHYFTESEARDYGAEAGSVASYWMEFTQKTPTGVSAVYRDDETRGEEKIHIGFTDAGIIHFHWDNPKQMEVVEK